MTMDVLTDEEEAFFKRESSTETAVDEFADSSIHAEKKTLFERLRGWPGTKYVLGLLFLGKLGAASVGENQGQIVETGEKITASASSEAATAIEKMSEESTVREIQMDPAAFLLKVQNIKDFHMSPTLVGAMAESDPSAFFIYQADVVPYSNPETVRAAAIQGMLLDPTTAVYENDPFITGILNSGDVPEAVSLKTLIGVPASHRDRIAMATLLDPVHRGTMTVEQAASLVEDERGMMRELIRIRSNPDALGRIAVDSALTAMAHKTVDTLNELHERPDKERFASVDGAGPLELYAFVVYGEEGAYPSTYNGLLTRMLDKMEKTGMTGSELFKEVGDSQFRAFMRQAIQHDRIDDFLSSMSAPEQEQAIRSFVEHLDTQPHLVAEAAMISDALRNIKDPALKKTMEDSIKNEYIRVSAGNDAEATIAYGILSAIIDPNASWVPKDRLEDFRVTERNEISPNELRNKDGNVVERYFFYDDEDGRSSFGHFLARVEGTPGWSVEKHKEYVVAKMSAKGHGVVIYANRPAFEASMGTSEVDPVAVAMDNAGVEATVVAHRGHVYHQEVTIDKLTKDVQIFFNGGCSGFNSTESVLKINPEAHIFSNQGTGTKRVNDTLLVQLERDLVGDAPIVWDRFFEEAGKKLRNDKDFPKYVSPSRNYAAQYFVAFDHALSAYGSKSQESLLVSSKERPV